MSEPKKSIKIESAIEKFQNNNSLRFRSGGECG
jgi:hypothetical protein